MRSVLEEQRFWALGDTEPHFSASRHARAIASFCSRQKSCFIVLFTSSQDTRLPQLGQKFSPGRTVRPHCGVEQRRSAGYRPSGWGVRLLPNKEPHAPQ
jgi:hypothetical protein